MKKLYLSLQVPFILLMVAVLFMMSSCGADDSDGPDEINANGKEAATNDSEDAKFNDIRPNKQNFGDFDEMKKRRIIRALVPYSLTSYFIDDGVQRGVAYESLKAFEEYINKKLNTGNLKIHIIIMLTSREEMIPKLVAGYGDIALGNYTITEERLKKVGFTDPILTGVNEIIISGPKSPKFNRLDDLSGQEIWVRKTSSYYQSLRDFNELLKKEGKVPVKINEADENLEDEDLLEMANAGLINLTVSDSHLARFWSQIFENIKIHTDFVLRSGGGIAWMIRKDCPELKKTINSFIKDHKKGTEFGNILFNRYLKNTKWVNDSLDQESRDRFNSMSGVFQKYADQYEFDWLMITAQAYQESKLDQYKRSPAGAIGVMQILPATASDPNVGIKNIENLDNNIHAGTKYLRFMTDRYFNEPGLDPRDRMLFAFASYNAGPAKISKMRNIAEQRGLGPDVWFRNVETVVADKIGRETVTYVSNIYKYYIVYKLVVEQTGKREKVKGLRD